MQNGMSARYAQLAYLVSLYRFRHTHAIYKIKHTDSRSFTYICLFSLFLSFFHIQILTLFFANQHVHTRTLFVHGRIINKNIRDVKRTGSSRSDIVLLDLNATLVLDAIHFCSL